MLYRLIKKIVGNRISESELNKIVYAHDSSSIKGTVRFVVWPETPEEISEIIKHAKNVAISITPRGGGTSLTGGAVPVNDIVMDLSRMNSIRVDEHNMTAIVEAGVILDDLNHELKKYNLFFPVVPSSSSACTIGGMISTNAGGSKTLKYGKMRKWVEELEVVTGTGKIKWTKKIDDFCGTEGTCGVITKAKLKLTKPVKTYMQKIFFNNVPDLVEKVKELRKDKNVIAIEFVNKITAKMLGREPKNQLIIEYEGENEEGMFKKSWEEREGIGPRLTARGFNHMEDPKIPIQKMSAFLKWLEYHEIPAFGHVGYGIIHPRFKQNSKLIEQMYEFVKELGGEVSGEHGYGLIKKNYTPYELKKKIQRLKTEYDPKKILNRGKIC